MDTSAKEVAVLAPSILGTFCPAGKDRARCGFGASTESCELSIWKVRCEVVCAFC